MKAVSRGNLLLAALAVLMGLGVIAYAKLSGPPQDYRDLSDEALNAPSLSGFKLTSTAVAEGGALPVDFTCDGKSMSLPVAWEKVPANTMSFALVMQHIAGPDDVHWYWILHHIPADVQAIAAGDKLIGVNGGNSVNPDLMYAPPCSRGPGIKRYSITVYALSAEPILDQGRVTRTALLAAIQDITLDHARLNITVTR